MLLITMLKSFSIIKVNSDYSVLITLISGTMTMHVLILINTAYHTFIVTINFYPDMT